MTTVTTNVTPNVVHMMMYRHGLPGLDSGSLSLRLSGGSFTMSIIPSLDWTRLR